MGSALMCFVKETFCHAQCEQALKTFWLRGTVEVQCALAVDMTRFIHHELLRKHNQKI